MSDIKRKVEWCIKKAEKEMNLGIKHRVLINIQPSPQELKKHILKAEHNLSAIEYFSDGGYSDWSMSAVFYCIYHCLLAIILKYGYESRNQECTIALIRYLKEENKINIDERFIVSLENLNDNERHVTNVIEKREYYTYGTSLSADNKNEIMECINLCKNCLNQTKNIVYE